MNAASTLPLADGVSLCNLLETILRLRLHRQDMTTMGISFRNCQIWDRGDRASFLVVGRAGVAVVEGGPAVPRSGYAGVADVAAPAGVVAVVHEDGLALVLLMKLKKYTSEYSSCSG